MKDRNVELYSRNIELEEFVSEHKTSVKVAQKVPLTENRTTNGHLEEMMNVQQLLREEMKEKDMYKQQAEQAIKQYQDFQREMNDYMTNTKENDSFLN